MVLGVCLLLQPILRSYGQLMNLQIVRSRWHVPLQTLGVVLAIVGYFLGHKHGGRQFAPNIHASFATSLTVMLAMQVCFGIYLKLHLEKGFHARLRRYTVWAHGILGKAMPVVSWVQMLFGGITALGFCRGDHLGQCLAHFIMGSAFIGYGIILTIILLVGQVWLKRTGRSQEFFDSLLIAAWGCVNTFTEHRWGTAWVRNDLQHTSMGVVWWCAGLLGVWLARKRDGRPKRNLIPGIVILLTGWAMSAHPQGLELSAKVHLVFGYTLMAAGLARIIEIAFVLRDQNSVSSSDYEETNSWQYLTPFVSAIPFLNSRNDLYSYLRYMLILPIQLLYTSGIIFMSATEQQIASMAAANVSHVSYILLLYSASFLLFLFVCMLLHLYATHAFPISSKSDLAIVDGVNEGDIHNLAGGRGRGVGGRLRNEHSARIARDAEEFELEGLMSDEEEVVGTNGKTTTTNGIVAPPR